VDEGLEVSLFGVEQPESKRTAPKRRAENLRMEKSFHSTGGHLIKLNFSSFLLRKARTRKKTVLKRQYFRLEFSQQIDQIEKLTEI